MQTKGVIVVLLLWGITVGLTSCSEGRSAGKKTEVIQKLGTVPELSKDSLIRRGGYLVNTMGCHDCHSPKRMTPRGPELDPDRLLSGHPAAEPLPKVDTKLVKDWVLFNPQLTAAVGPWGASYAANLTSDATGVGNWTEEQFKIALREGKYKGQRSGRNLLPPMPWQVFKNLGDQDLKAMFLYLKSVKPVKNVPPAPKALAELQ
jgi:hypothetical protein